MEHEGENNRKAATILSELIAKGLVKQDDDGSIQVPSASKKRPGVGWTNADDTDAEGTQSDESEVCSSAVIT